WVLPRPALPGEVADALYGEEEHKDSVAVHRLRAMVDSLNVIIDQEQRARQKPTWTTEVAGKTIGIDSQYIHVAGIKIPKAVPSPGLAPSTLLRSSGSWPTRCSQDFSLPLLSCHPTASRTPFQQNCEPPPRNSSWGGSMRPSNSRSGTRCGMGVTPAGS